MTADSALQIVAVAVIWCDDRLVLQLRDFRAGIADPGEWGFFGGHLEAGESEDAALRRELHEEIGWAPPDLTPLGTFDPFAGLRIVGFRTRYERPVESLVLGEGQELGAFTLSELMTGRAYSRRWRHEFPLTEITRQGLHRWCVSPHVAS